jgi:hypothetical protein
VLVNIGFHSEDGFSQSCELSRSKLSSPEIQMATTYKMWTTKSERESTWWFAAHALERYRAHTSHSQKKRERRAVSRASVVVKEKQLRF